MDSESPPQTQMPLAAGIHQRTHFVPAHRYVVIGKLMGTSMSRIPDSKGFVYEDSLQRITGVPRSTRQNWIRAQALPEDPADGRYNLEAVVETALVRRIVRVLKRLEDVARLWQANRRAVLEAAALLEQGQHLIAVIEPRLLKMTLAETDADVGKAVRPLEQCVAVPLEGAIEEAGEGFAMLEQRGAPKADRRRRDAAGSPTAARGKRPGARRGAAPTRRGPH